MTKKKTLSAIVAVAIAACASGYFLHGSASTPPQSSMPDDTSTLVRTQALQKQMLQSHLDVYGEVTTGKVEGVSFPRAGQVSNLLITQGQMVKRGTPLVTLTTDPNVQMAFNQATSAVAYAQAELKRTQNLFSLQLATQSQVDNAWKALQDAETNLQAQKKLGGDVTSATVNAPFDGVITALSVAQGDRIQPGATILQLGHTNALRVQLGLEPNDAHQIVTGTPVTITPIQDEQHSVKARVAFTQDLLDPKTQLINAVVFLPVQVDQRLVPGMKVRASLETGQREAWVLPRQAVLSDSKGSYIFQITNGIAHRVDVAKSQENGNQVAITGPITDNLPVVVLGNYELQDGMKVREGAQ